MIENRFEIEESNIKEKQEDNTNEIQDADTGGNQDNGTDEKQTTKSKDLDLDADVRIYDCFLGEKAYNNADIYQVYEKVLDEFGDLHDSSSIASMIYLYIIVAPLSA